MKRSDTRVGVGLHTGPWGGGGGGNDSKKTGSGRPWVWFHISK